MHRVIKEILKSNKSSSEKSVDLNSLLNDINVAKVILYTNKYIYCEECDEYYLTEKFSECEEKNDVNIYDANIYHNNNDKIGQGILVRRYRCCPKGHKAIIHEKVLVQCIDGEKEFNIL